MKTVFNAFYLGLFLHFARKIFRKVSTDLGDVIQRKSRDSSGCWNVVVHGVSVFYSWEKATALEVARLVREEVPGLQGEHDIEVIEDENMIIEAPEDVPGISASTCEELGLVINVNE